MIAKHASHIGFALTVGLLAAGESALAQGVGNPGSLPTQFQSTTPVTGWVVLDPSGGPVPVVLNPQGPVWQKNFTGPNGQSFQAAPFQSFTVQEALTVAGTLPWTDWHEQILNPDWTWSSPSILVNGASAPGLTISNTPGTPTQGGDLSFFFNPVAPGSTVIISKSLTYTGAVGSLFNATLRVNEFPTPEPASLLMMAGASALLIKRRRGLAANVA